MLILKIMSEGVAPEHVLISGVESVSFMRDGDNAVAVATFPNGTQEQYKVTSYTYVLNENGKTIDTYSPIPSEAPLRRVFRVNDFTSVAEVQAAMPKNTTHVSVFKETLQKMCDEHLVELIPVVGERFNIEFLGKPVVPFEI